MVVERYNILLTTLAIWLLSSLLLTSYQVVFIVLAFLVLFCLPGWILYKYWDLGQETNGFLKLSVSCVTGYLISTITSIIILSIYTGNHYVVLVFQGVFVLVLLFLRQTFLVPSSSLDSHRFKDILVFLLIVIMMLFFVLPPLADIGYPFPEGKVFRAYFNSDYLKHMAITAHLSHSNIPPDNPYLYSDKPFHYYWFFYIFPSIVASFSFDNVKTLDILRVLNIWLVLMFLALIFGLLRTLTKNLISIFFVIFCGFFAYSYEGLYIVLLILREGKPLFQELVKYNVDGLTRWFIGDPQIDGLYRTFIYTPQHLFALSLFAISIFQVASIIKKKRITYSSLWIAGLTNSLIFGFSAFIGLVATIWLITISVLYSIFRRNFSFLFHIIASLIIPYLGFIYLGIIELKYTTLVFSPQTAVINHLTRFLLLNFGVLLFLVPIGLVQGFRKNRVLCLLVTVAFIQSLTMILFVQLRGFPTEMGLKVGIILSLTMIIFGGLGLPSSRGKYAWIWILIFILIIPGSLTILIDLFNTCNIENYRFMSLIEWEDMEACDWIRKNLPTESRVQSDPFGRGVSYSLIASFAERRMVLGDEMHSQIFLEDINEYQEYKTRLNQIFQEPDPIITEKIMKESGIDYIFLGSTERRIYAESLEKFKNFVCEYRNKAVCLYSNMLLASIVWNDLPPVSWSPGDVKRIQLQLHSNDSRFKHKFLLNTFLVEHGTKQNALINSQMVSLSQNEDKLLEIPIVIDPEYFPGEYVFSIQLYHVPDEMDSEFKNSIPATEFFSNYHSTGKLLTLDGKKIITTRTPPEIPGTLVKGSLGILPPGFYQVEVVIPDESKPPTNVFIRLLSGSSNKPIIDEQLVVDPRTGKLKHTEFKLNNYHLVNLELYTRKGSSVEISSFLIHWESPEPMDLPLARLTSSIILKAMS